MKKLALTIAIVLGMGMSTFAQDAAIEERGLFGRGEGIYRSEEKTLVTPGLPNHGESENQDAPLGSGIAVLMGLGAAYMAAKKRNED